jgi:GTPase SAR1 family protein
MMNFIEKSKELETLVVSQGSITQDLKLLEVELIKTLSSLKKGYGVVISGDSGSGKTTLLNKFIEQTKEYIAENNLDVSIVYMETPSNPVGKDLFEAMIEAAGSPGSDTGAVNKLKERKQQLEIMKLIQSKNIRIWIFDEFQQATEKWGDKKVRQTADFLKSLTNSLPILLVFAGTEKVKKLLDNEQFNSRSSLIEKEKMHVDNLKNYNLYLDYLSTLQAHMGIGGIDWSSPEIALPIFYDSRGDMRRISDILQTTLSYSDSVGAKKLTKKCFSAAWKQRYFATLNVSLPFKGNTFGQPIQKLTDALDINYEIKDV